MSIENLLSDQPTNKKICIISPNWIGDMMMAQSLFKWLKQQNSNTQIDVFARARTYPLLQYMPEVDNRFLLPFERGQWCFLKRIMYARHLKKSHDYHQAIVLPNSWKSAIIPFFAGIPKRTGWVGEIRFGILNDCRQLPKKQLPRMVDRFLALGVARNCLSWPTLNHSLYPVLQLPSPPNMKLLDQFGLHLERPIIALCPGAAYGPSKQWPARHFAILANRKIEEGYQVWILGSKNDRSIAQMIGHQSHCINLAGKTNLEEVITLLSLTKIVVTNDSGLMHIACALKRLVIVLYGSTSPLFTPPLLDYCTSHKKSIVLSLNLPCSPCFKRQCPLQHHNCMNDLQPQQVLDAIKRLESN